MTLSEEILERLNGGKLAADILGEIVYDFAQRVKGERIQKLFREKAAKNEKTFVEFLLIETCRGILKMTPTSFYF